MRPIISTAAVSKVAIAVMVIGVCFFMSRCFISEDKEYLLKQICQEAPESDACTEGVKAYMGGE
jgi:hypothetical protein